MTLFTERIQVKILSLDFLRVFSYPLEEKIRDERLFNDFTVIIVDSNSSDLGLRKLQELETTSMEHGS